MKHGRPSPLRPNHYIDDIETGCKCPACMLGSGWRREHAHRVFAAIQAVVAVTIAVRAWTAWQDEALQTTGRRWTQL